MEDESTSKGSNQAKTNRTCMVQSSNQMQKPNRIMTHSPVEINEEKVVMRITPKPPVRKRPKSTPVLDHVSNQLSQMMEDKMR